MNCSRSRQLHHRKRQIACRPQQRQRGVVLFFTMLALVVMSLAAVSLIRSVDTSGMIAGNMANKHSTLISADSGSETAIAWLSNAQNQALVLGLNAATDATHPFNITAKAQGYYASYNANLSLTDGSGIKWDNTDSALVGTDAAGNQIRYIIQRMCTLDQPFAAVTNNCLFSEPQKDKNNQAVPLPQQVCNGPGCPSAGQSPMMRITVRSSGPKNSLTYLQAFAY